MQPTLCSKCKKNVAVVFISRQNEKGEMVNEGLCLKCAAQLGLPQVEEMMKRMGISPEDLENINNEMMQAFGGAEELSDIPAPQDEDDEDDGESGKTATFPFLNRLFGGSNPPAEKSAAPSGREEAPKGRKADKKHKYLDSYCINLSQRARDGKLDAVIGREEEIQRVVQILNRRQKNNPCLIGEPGVGKTAIAEGLAQRIAAGDVPFKLRDKEVFLLDLTDTGLTGKAVQDELDRHGITLNKNCVPNETRSPQQTSGVRIGTAAMTTTGYTEQDFIAVARQIDRIIRDMQDMRKE